MKFGLAVVVLAMLAPPTLASFEPGAGWHAETLPIEDVDASVGRWSHATLTDGGRTYFIYHGASVPTTVWVTYRDHETGEMAAPVAVGRSGDDHGHPSLAMDSHGHLHVTFGGHVTDQTPIVHRQSAAPRDISAWTGATVLERTANSAYTFLAIDNQDTLFVVYRQGGATQLGNGDLVIQTRPAGEAWQAAQILIGHPSWSIYPSDLLVGPDGRIDIAWHVRDFGVAVGMPGTLHSRDGGKTWEDSRSRSVRVPVLPTQLPRLDDSMLPDGWPAPQLARDERALYALYAVGDHLAGPQVVWLATRTADGWLREPVTQTGLRSRSLTWFEDNLLFLSIDPSGDTIRVHRRSDDGWTKGTAFTWTGEGRLSRPSINRGLSHQGAAVDAIRGFGVILPDDGTSGQLYWLEGLEPKESATDNGTPGFLIPPLLGIAYVTTRWKMRGSWSIRTSSTKSPT